MTVEPARSHGVEWAGEPPEPRPSGVGWPELRPADRCDGENPMTGHPCVSGNHRGYHQDRTGAKWLDE